MAEITVLDNNTIDHIAAGEVVERPASVVKELVENACDAGATAVTVEIKDGGTSFIRVTDNGSGIEKEQVKKAFLRHATSKIRTIEDLWQIKSMGFRGEALSSISAVGMVEIEGEREREFSEIGAPEGTTIIVRDLFFNTPARRKFLKTAATEGSYVADLMEHMALARPDISFQLIQNRQPRFSTSGSGDLKEVVYRIYGREIAKEIFPFRAQEDGILAEGFLGTPQLVRPNRNFEFFFVNRRYIKSQILSKGLEAGYAQRLMQHKFPMAYLHLSLDTKDVDVNVHPAKMEVRFSDNPRIFDFLERSVREALKSREMIPAVTFAEAQEKKNSQERMQAPENSAPDSPPYSQEKQAALSRKEENKDADASANGRQIETQKREAQEEAVKLAKQLLSMPRPTGGSQRTPAQNGQAAGKAQPHDRPPLPVQPFEKKRLESLVHESRLEYEAKEPGLAKPKQMDLFEEKILTAKAVQQYELIGQIFDTYWIASYQDKMILIDQHAAHEKVKYEALIKKLKEGGCDSQNLMPPVIVTLTNPEAALLSRYREYFAQLGFEIEDFGGNSYALRSVPCDLYGNFGDALLQEILNDLLQDQKPGTPAAITERIATMACKAAVKGNHRMSHAEMQALLEQLLALDNPYQCPHGRPTMITMTKQELERKFKRIL